MGFRKVVGKVKRFVIKNGPTICTVLGCAGVIATGVLSYRAGAKCDKILSEMGDDASVRDKVAAVGPHLTPTVIVGTASIAAIIFGRRLSAKEIVLLSASNASLSASLFEFKRAVKERVGEEEYKEILRQQAARDMSDISIIDDDVDISFWDDELNIITLDPHGSLFHIVDGHDSIWFRQNKEVVRNAINELHYYIKEDGYTTKSDFFSDLEFDRHTIPDSWGYIGWSTTDLINEYGTTGVDILIEEGCTAYQSIPFLGYATPDGEIKEEYTLIDFMMPSRALF